jgi:hypothetical protein
LGRRTVISFVALGFQQVTSNEDLPVMKVEESIAEDILEMGGWRLLGVELRVKVE